MKSCLIKWNFIIDQPHYLFFSPIYSMYLSFSRNYSAVFLCSYIVDLVRIIYVTLLVLYIYFHAILFI